MKQIHEKEKDVQKACLDYLAARGIFNYRNNTGSFQDRGTGAWYRFGAVGSPDIIAVVKGRYIAIECKGTKGKQSDVQKDFEDRLVRAGGFYILVRSLDELIESLHNLEKELL